MALFWWGFLGVLGLGLIPTSGWIVGVEWREEAILQRFEQAQQNLLGQTQIYDQDHTRLASLSGWQKREVVPRQQFPPVLVKAVLAIEDHRFYRHHGLDLIRIGGVVLKALTDLELTEGASTITQQLVKLTLLSPERSLSRKAREIAMAVIIERHYSKDDLLTLYLNQIYMGRGLYGMAEASQGYFRKPVTSLSLAEAAWLAALIKKPEGYLDVSLARPTGDDAAGNDLAGNDPAAQIDSQIEPPSTLYLPMARLDALRHRTNLVLERLHALRWISIAEYAAALEQPARPYRPRAEADLAPYFVQHVLKEARGTFGTQDLAGLELQIVSTLDPELQTRAEAAITRALKDESDGRQGALVALDARSGAIRALVGGVDFRRSEFNRATQALRQPGSAFKPILYAAALEKLPNLHPATLFVDEPVRYQRHAEGHAERLRGQALIHAATEERNTRGPNTGEYGTKERGEGDPSAQQAPTEIYTPLNFNRRYGEPSLRDDAFYQLVPTLTLGRALELSSNVIAVQLLDRLGLQELRSVTQKLALPLRTRAGLCVALGCSEVSLLQLTAAYGSFANGGLQLRPYGIERIEDREGTLLYEHQTGADQTGAERALSPFTARRMQELLTHVVEHGTGRRARVTGQRVAGKTGTNDGPRDAWFIGFTPTLIMGVWLGHDDNQVMPGEQGGRTPARLWAEVISSLPASSETETFPALPGTAPAEKLTICSVGGELQQPRPAMPQGVGQEVDQAQRTPETVISPQGFLQGLGTLVAELPGQLGAPSFSGSHAADAHHAGLRLADPPCRLARAYHFRPAESAALRARRAASSRDAFSGAGYPEARTKQRIVADEHPASASRPHTGTPQARGTQAGDPQKGTLSRRGEASELDGHHSSRHLGNPTRMVPSRTGPSRAGSWDDLVLPAFPREQSARGSKR